MFAIYNGLLISEFLEKQYEVVRVFLAIYVNGFHITVDHFCDLLVSIEVELLATCITSY